jgi:hypothetical protein
MTTIIIVVILLCIMIGPAGNHHGKQQSVEHGRGLLMAAKEEPMSGAAP